MSVVVITRISASCEGYGVRSFFAKLYGGPQLSRQNQKPHGKNKIPHGKTKNLTAKPNTSQQKQNGFGFAVDICFCRWVFGFCCEVFGFAVRSLVFP